MNKSLAPLILFFAVIILSTIIIINSHSPRNVVEYEKENLIPVMDLGSYKVRKVKQQKKNGTQYEQKLPTMNSKETLSKARTLLTNGKINEAEDILRTHLVFDPNNSQVLSLLGGLLCYTQRYKEAEMIFYKQIKLNPDHSESYAKLFYTLYHQDKRDQAKDVLETGIQIKPDSPEFLINMAALHAKTGKTEIAINYFKRAHKLIGQKILIFSYDSDFDNLRNHPEFVKMVKDAEKASAKPVLNQKTIDKNSPENK